MKSLHANKPSLENGIVAMLSGNVLVLEWPNAALTGSVPISSGLGLPINFPPNLVGDPIIVGSDPNPWFIGEVQPIGKGMGAKWMKNGHNENQTVESFISSCYQFL